MVSKYAYMRQFRPPMGSDCCEHLLNQDRFAPIAFQGSLTVTVGKSFHNIRLSQLKYVYIDLMYAAFPDYSIVGHPLLDTQKSNQHGCKHHRRGWVWVCYCALIYTNRTPTKL